MKWISTRYMWSTLALMFVSLVSHSAVFTVTNLNDASLGSLRQAIIDANGVPTDDIIDFSQQGTISLLTGQLPTITDNVTIEGSGIRQRRNLSSMQQTCRAVAKTSSCNAPK